MSNTAPGVICSLKRKKWKLSGAMPSSICCGTTTPASIPAPCLGHIRNEDRWHRYLHAQYRRCWKVHFPKKTRSAWRSVKYLGRYLEAPTGGSLSAPALPRRRRGPSVLRSPHAAQTAEDQPGGDVAALRQPHPVAAF